MLSILIPTYDYDTLPLVRVLHEQCISCNIDFEILVYDDGSNSEINKKNELINKFTNCLFKPLNENIGRSAIRNLLGKKAQYENLLFLDSDVLPKESFFIKKYVSNLNKKVQYGGITHTEKPPKKTKKLRWRYTKKRERFLVTSANFFIKKNIFIDTFFDESLKKYGCEDVLFFESLINKKIKISYINNPVFHLGNDEANIFIKKTNMAITNLIYLIDSKKISQNKYMISKVYNTLSKIRLEYVISFLFKIFKPILIKNFNSSYPSIILFDFYRLGFFCLLKTKN